MALQDRYINPFTDFGFKKLFGSEPNKDLLIDFLNLFLPERHRIQDLSYTDSAQSGRSETDRKAIFDIACTGANGERFIVEMQKAQQDFFKDRSVYYASFPIQEQALRGDWDYELSHVYTFGVLDFRFPEHADEAEMVHVVQLKDQQCRTFYDKLTFVYIEMPKFNKTEAELVTLQDKWLYVLRNLPRLTDLPAKMQERVFKKLFAVAEIAKYTPQERAAYESSLKYYRDWKSVADTAARIGREEGREEGREQREIEAIVGLYANGIAVPLIARSLGLSEGQVQKVIDEHLSAEEPRQ